MGALQHGAARTVLDNRVRLSVRAKNRLDRTVADDGMHAIGSRDYVAVSEVNAIVIPGSDDGKRIRAGTDHGRYVALGPKSVRMPDCGWLLLSNMDPPITHKLLGTL